VSWLRGETTMSLKGVDDEGQWRSGVLEASWRSGGASTAELTALAAFVQSPGLQVVEASAVKEFGKGRNVPRGAIVHFRGDDPEDGPIVRYTMMTERCVGPVEIYWRLMTWGASTKSQSETRGGNNHESSTHVVHWWWIDSSSGRSRDRDRSARQRPS